MRGILMLLLLASAASPAIAQPDEDRAERISRAENRAAIRAERSEPRAERGSAPERSARAEQSDRGSSNSEQVRAWHGGERDLDRPRRTQEVREERRSMPVGVPQGGDSVRDWRPRDRGSDSRSSGPVATPQHDGTGRGWTQQPRDGDVADRRFQQALDRRFGDRYGRLNDGRPYDGRWRERARDGLAVSATPRFGTQPPLRADRRRRDWESQWSRHWRDDRRYDWRHHRDRNRSIFRVGFYYDPFGWNYQRYDIGWRMWPSYYGRSHWLSDPWRYRLPPAYPGTQWIRYHGDAILVDTWTGEVVDVIHDFFW